MNPNSEVMQLTIEFYPAVNHNYDDNPMDPKNHHQQQGKNQPNKQNGHNLLNLFTKTLLFRETFAKIIDSSVNCNRRLSLHASVRCEVHYEHGGCVTNHYRLT